MDIATLPIMLFDERKLTPSFGYVFDRKWLDPYESIVSLLRKLARMNRLSGQMIAMHLAKSSIDPYEGVPACRSAVDMRRLHLAIRLPLGVVRGALFPDDSCGHRYGSSHQSLVNRRPFNKKARTAITRLRWSYFQSF